MKNTEMIPCARIVAVPPNNANRTGAYDIVLCEVLSGVIDSFSFCEVVTSAGSYVVKLGSILLTDANDEYQQVDNSSHDDFFTVGLGGLPPGLIHEGDLLLPTLRTPPFWLMIEDQFLIEGRGVVVTGHVESGQVKVGDRVSLVSTYQEKVVTVTGLEQFRKLLQEANEGDNVGIFLRGVTAKSEVPRASVLKMSSYDEPYKEIVTRDGELYMFGEHITFSDSTTVDTHIQVDQHAAAEDREHKECNEEKRSVDEEIDELIGLLPVKEEIRKLANFVRVQSVRTRSGMKAVPISYHCVFTGNPGTGKTTVARILARIYRELGVLKKGHLIETDRSGLVAEYVGQTAIKTNKIIDSALDGVLFIDEAYSLVDGGDSDYGKEAISTLLKRMEDDRDRLVVILAGYTEDMKRFIASNPDLQSRFNRYICFPDYTKVELIEIFGALIAKNQYQCDEDALTCVSNVIENAVDHKDRHFGNARFVRNLFEKIIERQATRISISGDLSKNALETIKACDIEKGI